MICKDVEISGKSVQCHPRSPRSPSRSQGQRLISAITSHNVNHCFFAQSKGFRGSHVQVGHDTHDTHDIHDTLAWGQTDREKTAGGGLERLRRQHTTPLGNSPLLYCIFPVKRTAERDFAADSAASERAVFAPFLSTIADFSFFSLPTRRRISQRGRLFLFFLFSLLNTIISVVYCLLPIGTIPARHRR